jgi:NADH dehydrogenase
MTTETDLCVVTGALGYSGRHIAQSLLAAGKQVRTITGHPERPDPFDGRVEVLPLCFAEPSRLRAALTGARVLYNTYWIRFDRGSATHELAVERSLELFAAAADAGVERIVHVSITNPTADSPLPYFRGKARLEQALRSSGLSYGIVRPTVLFGGNDVLINNIAWLLRRLPLFGVPGDGRCGIQPVHVDDLARLAVELGSQSSDVVVDAVGPERFEYLELVRLIAQSVGGRARIVRVPRWVMLSAARVLGVLLGDVVLTADEVDGLMANLLVSDDEATGPTRFSTWLAAHAGELGRCYASELARHYR